MTALVQKQKALRMEISVFLFHPEARQTKRAGATAWVAGSDGTKCADPPACHCSALWQKPCNRQKRRHINALLIVVILPELW